MRVVTYIGFFFWYSSAIKLTKQIQPLTFFDWQPMTPTRELVVLHGTYQSPYNRSTNISPAIPNGNFWFWPHIWREVLEDQSPRRQTGHSSLSTLDIKSKESIWNSKIRRQKIEHSHDSLASFLFSLFRSTSTLLPWKKCINGRATFAQASLGT